MFNYCIINLPNIEIETKTNLERNIKMTLSIFTQVNNHRNPIYNHEERRIISEFRFPR